MNLSISSFTLHFLAARLLGCHNLCKPDDDQDQDVDDVHDHDGDDDHDDADPGSDP